MEKPSYRAYRFSELVPDLKRRQLLGGREQELSPQAFRVLEYLCENPRTLVTKMKLINEVWGTRGRHVTEASVKTFISEIRKALGEKGNIIKTWPKNDFAAGDYIQGGYSLDCEVEKIEADPDDEERTGSEATSSEMNPSQESAKELTQSDDSSDGPRMDPSIAPVVTAAGEKTEKGSASAADLAGGPRASPDDLTNKQKQQGSHEDVTLARGESDYVTDDDSETFERWYSGMGIVFLLGAAIILTAAFSYVEAPAHEKELHKEAMRVASGAQCVVIFLMLLYSLFITKAKGFRENEECSEANIVKAGFKNRAEFEKERASLEYDLRGFTLYWQGLLLSWVPLYFVYWFGEHPYFAHFLGDHLRWKVGLHLWNTAMLCFCFNSLNKYADEHDRNHTRRSFLNIAMLLVVGGGGAVTLFRQNDPDGAILLTGIIGGGTMALFIGRLQSRFISPSFWLLYLLYSYTAIQPLVLYIENRPDWGWTILNFALFLKCLLYVYMLWLFHSGLLLFYFVSVKRLNNKALDEQREAFSKLLRKRP